MSPSNDQMRRMDTVQAQREITVKGALLDGSGNIAQPGFAKKMNWVYDRAQIKARRMRIKEWDYYYIGNTKYALTLTIADLGYVGALSLSFLDYRDASKPCQFTNTSTCLFPLGSMKMPSTYESGDCEWANGKVKMVFRNDGNARHLTGEFPNADKKGTTVKWDITLSQAPEECMVIATPFCDKYFYFNAKVNCMRADGSFFLNDTEFKLSSSNTADMETLGGPSLATLDWGRGVWTYDNTWYWGSLQTVLPDGKTFGWNIGYGFGDTSAATEDMLFYDGKSHKLPCKVEFIIPGDAEGAPRYMEEWKFLSSDNRVSCTFKPLIDRNDPFDLKLICMLPHQVFGYATGSCTLDDGTVIEIKDVLCFAEKVRNKW